MVPAANTENKKSFVMGLNRKRKYPQPLLRGECKMLPKINASPVNNREALSNPICMFEKAKPGRTKKITVKTRPMKATSNPTINRLRLIAWAASDIIVSSSSFSVTDSNTDSFVLYRPKSDIHRICPSGTVSLIWLSGMSISLLLICSRLNFRNPKSTKTAAKIAVSTPTLG